MPRSDDELGGHPKRYRVLREIAHGGSGVVNECFDRVLRRPVAVKVVHPLVGAERSDEEAVLEREALVTAGLEHPNIVPIHDAGRNEDGRRFYVMRLLDETNLEDVLKRLAAGDRRATRDYTFGRLIRLFLQTCQAVEYAHNRGIIHCDLKPANVVLGSFGEVFIVDWGLAFSTRAGTGFRGGTPGYMAPEQVDQSRSALDARTDVFALGAILYKILCLRHPFFEMKSSRVVEFLRSINEDLHVGACSRTLRPPSEAAPDRDVPARFEEISMRALELDPERRFASAGEMATAIEEALDRTKELERLRSEAERSFEEANELAARYHEFVESRPAQLARFEQLRQEIRPWEELSRKQKLWDAEERITVTDALRVRTLQAAVAVYERALDAAPNHPGARRQLARLYSSELELAQERGDELDRMYFEGLLRQYDDGELVQALTSGGKVTLQVSGSGLTLRLHTLVEKSRRLVSAGDPKTLESGDQGLELGTGRYLLSVAHESGREARYPLLVRPGSEQRAHIAAADIAGLDAHDVLIPGGPALLGGDPTGSESGARREVEIPGFVLGRFPITFRDYFEFLDEQMARGSERMDGYVPTDRNGHPYFIRGAGSWSPRSFPESWLSGDPLDLPVFGVDAQSASDYATWLSKRTGKRYRLPSDYEWEKAARGVDGRLFPWGDRFEALFCKMRDSRPGISAPEAAGTFELDESPYGVRDMAGTIAEWVSVPKEERQHGRRWASRGGAWCDSQVFCRATSRWGYSGRERTARVGFRLARELD